MKSFDFTPILGWSVSRFDTFTMCKRKYYYNYYGKYDENFKLIKELKKLTSIALEVGNITHDIIKSILERLIILNKQIDNKKLEKYCYDISIKYCNDKIFSEIYYKEKEEIDKESIYKKVLKSIFNLVENHLFAWITNKAVQNKKEWIIEPPGYGETRIDNLKAYCKVDFLFPYKDIVYIVDWKTGKVNLEKHKKQLTGYSLWAYYHLPEYKTIKSAIIYLYPEYKLIKPEITIEDIENFKDQVKKETQILYEYCNDIDENIPIEKEKFILTENRKICNYCNFRELCKR